jgi:hypothetical protein
MKMHQLIPVRYLVELWLKKHVQAVVYLGVTWRFDSIGGRAIFFIICTTFVLRLFIVS